MTESHRLPVPLFRDRIETPIGGFALVVDAEGRLHAAGFLGDGSRTVRWLESFCARAPSIEDAPDPGGLSTALARYFRGDLAAIDGLPEKEREVFELVRIQGLSHSETAELLGVSTKYVQLHLRRALVLLDERLHDLWPQQNTNGSSHVQ